jgi:hypothetical protein
MMKGKKYPVLSELAKLPSFRMDRDAFRKPAPKICEKKQLGTSGTRSTKKKSKGG